MVRRLADRHGIDVSQLTGSGTGGRVTKRDVEAYLEAMETGAAPTAERADEIVEPSPIRRMIAENMSRSFREIPHAWGAIEVDVSGDGGVSECELGAGSAEYGSAAYVSADRAASCRASAWSTHRLLNSSWDNGKVVLKGAVNVGVAVASEQGLVVPVVCGADGLSLEETVSEMASGSWEGARAGKLRLEDVQGGTFTLNNTGALGSVLGGAIINYPQAAILTTESIVKRPVVVTTLGRWRSDCDPFNDEHVLVVRSPDHRRCGSVGVHE